MVSMDEGRFVVHPAQNVTPPQMALDAMLKKRGATLDLIPDHGMYHMIEIGMMFGVCIISQGYANDNNELVREYNPEH